MISACEFEQAGVYYYHLGVNLTNTLTKPAQWIFGDSVKIPKANHHWIELHCLSSFYIIQKLRNGDICFEAFSSIDALRQRARESADATKNAIVWVEKELEAPQLNR